MIFPILVLVGAIGLLQWHSCAFWMAHAGAAGWAWSLLLEVVGLWCWYQPQSSRRALGVVASVLLLVGPLYQVSAPLVAELQGAETAGAQTALLREEIASLETTLATLRRNSEARPGWWPAIAETETRLTAARAELRALAAAPPAPGWTRRALILLQAVALILFQVASIAAITTLGARPRHAPRPRETETPKETRARAPRKQRRPAPGPAKETPAPETTIDAPALARRLTRYLESNPAVSLRAFAAQNNYPVRDLSLLLNHERLKQEGKRTASARVLERLAEQLDAAPLRTATH